MTDMKTALLLLCSIFLGAAKENRLFSQEKDIDWGKLTPYFSVPEKYADSTGGYRNPLTFYNGQTVKTPVDWKKRRGEILDRWQQRMGPWPALIKHPELKILDSERVENFIQYRVSFEWRRGEITKGYLLVPDRKGTGKRPAVITVFYEPESGIGKGRPHADFAIQIARRGIMVLSIGTDYLSTVKPYSQYYPSYDSATVQPLSMLGYLAANAYNALAGYKDVDAKRIGIAGHSYGGKWAMFASCLYDKFACAVWSDGGIVFDDTRQNVNYWDPWYLGYFPPPWGQKDSLFDASKPKGLYPRLRKEGYDLHELHALMAPRPFLVSGGSEDYEARWIALKQSVAVNKFLGYNYRVAMTNRPEHKPDAASKDQICTFFEQFLMTAEERKNRTAQ